MRLKRFAAGLLMLVVLASFAGCSRKEEPEARQITVCASFYPIYAIAGMLIEGVDDVHLNCLVQPQDGCFRDYQLSNWDAALISAADMVIVGGCGLESFESALYALGEDGPIVTAAIYGMDLLHKEGANTDADSDSHWLGENPHIYMSIEGAIAIAERIFAGLCTIDSGNAQKYEENLETAVEQLEGMLSENRDRLSFAAGTDVIVMNEALIYTADEYGFDVSLCYDRDSGEELSGTDLDACLKLLGRSGSRVVLIEKQAPQSLSEALENAGYILARMDVLSTGRANMGPEGYFDMQRSNARILEAAFRAVAS